LWTSFYLVLLARSRHRGLGEASKDICEIFQEALTYMPKIAERGFEIVCAYKTG
jgi:hypothetical protein